MFDLCKRLKNGLYSNRIYHQIRIIFKILGMIRIEIYLELKIDKCL